MKLKAFIALTMFCLAACNSGTETKTEAVDSAATTVTAADAVKSVVLPQSTNEPVQKAFEAFASGDMNAFSADWDDNVRVFYPGPGDSLIGKKAALEFFSARRSKYDSVQIVNPTFLAVQNNDMNTVAPGDWLMSWHTFVYKMKGNGKTVVLPIHSVQHKNSAGKIDIIAMYYDMHRLMEAAK